MPTATAAEPARKKTLSDAGRDRSPAALSSPQPAEAAEGPAGDASPSVEPLATAARTDVEAETVVIRFPPADQPPDVEAPEPQETAAASEQLDPSLSPSQKRRLRRRRRAAALREATQGSQRGDGQAEAAAPPGESETPAADQPAPADQPAAADQAAPAEAEAGEDTRRKRRRTRRRTKTRQPERAGESEPARPAVTDAKRVRKEMVINVVPREECRIAILEEGKLQEIYLERASAENHVGNIYKGVVTNVEASIQAAFIDFGLGKNGFLHISDVHPRYFPDRGAAAESVGRKTPRRRRPPIQRCLQRGREVIVQITKEGIGTKGPTLSTYLAIPGRFVVMMPGMRRLGVSRKIEDDIVRHKLRQQLDELSLPESMGFIARTAAEGHTKRELQSDLNYLTRLWKAVEKRDRAQRAPTELYRESDLVIRTIRDVFTSDVERIVVDDPEVAKRAREFLAIFSPRSRDAVVEYEGQEPIFHKYGIEAELERLHSRHVPLKSGGSLVIDQTEALVAIDVNSGRFRAEDDAETTAYKINLEAADEVPRQLRLRDLGGVIICDFIDMRQESHRRDIERRLARNLKQHKERAKVLHMSAFGIIEMTRQRQRASLTRSIYQDCRYCHGTGLVKTAESVALDVMRLLQLAVSREHIHAVDVLVSPEVADLLQNRKRSLIHQFETDHRRTISIRPGPDFGLDQVQIQCYDHRGRVVPRP